MLRAIALEHFPEEVQAHLDGTAEGVEPALIASWRTSAATLPLWDDRHRDKQPDWTYNAVDSGQAPAERFGVSGVNVPKWQRTQLLTLVDFRTFSPTHPS